MFSMPLPRTPLQKPPSLQKSTKRRIDKTTPYDIWAITYKLDTPKSLDIVYLQRTQFEIVSMNYY